jgi:DNA-binding Xre family transcriptional regulator
MKQIVDCIGWACLERGITARELARRGGLSTVVALQLMYGRHGSIPVKHLTTLCRVLTVQPADLLWFQDIADNDDAAD